MTTFANSIITQKKIMKKVITFISFILLAVGTYACTNFIVGKKASTDGSVIVSYNADSYGMYGNMFRHVGGTHKSLALPLGSSKKGEMRKVVEWDTNRYLGEIPQASVTYNVVGQMNEKQVSITETTFGGREELADSTGLIDYGSLIYIALERSTTAREAIKIMTDLVEKYGYCSEGETFSICDKNEAWVMEMMGKGPGGHGAVWVAVRIPDDCICAHANQSRITKFLKLFPKEDVIYSKDCISFAKKKGFFNGNNKEFSFRDAYAPCDFSANRYCEARVWSFFRHHADGMDKYLDYVMGKDIEHLASEMPLYLKPKTLVSAQDIRNDMRDHYEGTALDITDDLGAGAWDTPYRPSPLSKNIITENGDTIEVFNERPTSTQQTGFGFVGQMRSWLPDAVGGVVWWTNDDPNMAPYTPVYCGVKDIPECYQRKENIQDEAHFSWSSAFWLQNTVANIVYPYYSKIFPDLKKVRDELETQFCHEVETCTDSDPSLLTYNSLKAASEMMNAWKKLFEYIVVKHNDMVVKKEEDGQFKKSKYGFGAAPIRPGYSNRFFNKIKKETGDRYVIKK